VTKGAFALLVAALLAAGMRAIGYEWVLLGSEGVSFPIGDAAYHARLVSYAFENFPSFLTFDPYQNFPGGGAVQWPPAFDWTVAALGRLLSLDAAGVDVLLAWWPPLVGALTVVPVYLAARDLGGRLAGWLAAVMLALLPVSIWAQSVGNCDHHGTVALLAAAELALSLALMHQPERTSRLRWLAVGLFAARTLLVLTWSGSILYLGLADGALAGVGIVRARTRVVRLQALGLLASALAVLPILLRYEEILGGAFSAIALSWLHLVSMLGAALVLGLWCLWESRRPAATAWGRISRALVLAIVALALALLLSEVREALATALRFLGMEDVVGSITLEQGPLLPLFGRKPYQPPERMFGWLVYGIPLLPFALIFLSRRSAQRDSLLLLTIWTAVLGALAIDQNRYANELAAPASVGFAIVLVGVLRPLTAYARVPRAVMALGATALVVVSFWPTLAGGFVAGGLASLRRIGDPGPASARALLTPEGSFLVFARELRRLTPETAGFLDGNERPEYGVLIDPNLGDSLVQYGHRPTHSSNFWDHYPENFAAVGSFFDASAEDAALAIADTLRARYVLAAGRNGLVPGTLLHRLYVLDGTGRDRGTPLAQFRLITEGPVGGRPYTDLAGVPRPRGVVPYKLFQIVAGAQLEAEAPAGTPLRASVSLITPTGRRFRYETQAVADESGHARLRVPYATGSEGAVRALGPYRIALGDRERDVEVGEEDVASGRTIRVEAPLSTSRPGALAPLLPAP
jgi:dolichyl-diphosphooligosaccharide--protein glycosyltransferase